MIYHSSDSFTGNGMRFINLNQKTSARGSYSIKLNRQFYIIVYRAQSIGRKTLIRKIVICLGE